MRIDFPLARRASIFAVLLLLVSGTLRPGASAHPLHTTLGELTYAPTTGDVRFTIRVFADDLVRAVGRVIRTRSAAGLSRTGSTAAYLRSALVLRGSDGRPVPLRLGRVRKQGDVFRIVMHGSAPAGLKGGSIRNSLLFEMFEDQVNIVKARYGSSPRSLLFVRGDGAKRLP